MSMLALSVAALAGIAQALPVVPARFNSPLSKRAPTAPEGFTNTLFMDDFSTTNGTVDTNTWTYDLGTSYEGGPANWGTQEIQSYTSDASNIWINDEGNLVITPQVSYGAWTSSRIETSSGFDVTCPEGGQMRVEANIKLGDANQDPATQLGIWPAFWMLGSDFRGTYNWPAVGEIDILESANGDGTIYQTVHCGTAPGGVCNEYNGVGSTGSPWSRGDWHTAAVNFDRTNSDWTQQVISFLIDGTETYRVTPDMVSSDETAWDALIANSKFILLNVAVGGSFPNAIGGGITTPDANTIGGESVDMEIEYVAVWST